MRTFGVEEEFLLVDPDTGGTVPSAPEVLKAAGAGPPTVHAELLRSQVEAATAPCTTLTELAGELAGGRAHLAAAARECGVWLVPSGTAVLGGDPVISDGARFSAIAGTYAEVARDYQVCGCHVHVGVPDRETAVAVVNHVRPWLPALLALSVNSPFHHGRDTGYASWRMLAQARFPGSGVPPRFRDAADHDARVARLVECGVLADEAMSFWLVRPSPAWPTVEFRVADTAIDVPAALLQAALSRALVDTALAELARGRTGPELDDQVMAAAVWTAARHGLDTAVHPFLARRVPAVELLNELVVLLAPALAAAGDLRTVRDLFSAVLDHGTGAERQRSLADPRAVVRHLATGETYAD